MKQEVAVGFSVLPLIFDSFQSVDGVLIDCVFPLQQAEEFEGEVEMIV